MSRDKNLIIAGLLVCLANGISGYYGDTLNYKFEAIKNFQFMPNGSRTDLRFEMNVYIRAMNKKGSLMSITVRDLVITVERENGKDINLGQCKSSMGLVSSMYRPFLAVYDDDGLLQHIKVGQNEVEMAVNLKLYGASLLQLDLPQIRGESKPREIIRLTYAGLCPMKSEVMKNENDLSTRYTANMVECSEVKNDHRRDGATCSSHTCRSNETRDLRWIGELNARVKQMPSMPVIESLSLKMPVAYMPFEKSDDELYGNIIIRANLISTTGPAWHIPRHSVHDNVVVRGSRYRKLSKSICKAAPGNMYGMDDLRNMYCALTCQESMGVIYEDVLERAINCH